MLFGLFRRILFQSFARNRLKLLYYFNFLLERQIGESPPSFLFRSKQILNRHLRKIEISVVHQSLSRFVRRPCYFAISASISCGPFGTLLVSTRAPFSVTSTSSSMRTPMPRYFAGTS